MLQDAAPADRWTAKLLAYPCFDDGFRQAVLSTRLANLQFVLSVEADTPGQFADQVFQWTASSAKDVHELLLSRAPMLEQFWLFARAAEAVFTTRWDSLAARRSLGKDQRARSLSSNGTWRSGHLPHQFWHLNLSRGCSPPQKVLQPLHCSTWRTLRNSDGRSGSERSLSARGFMVIRIEAPARTGSSRRKRRLGCSS